MADIRLADFVLLQCEFELWPERDTAEDSSDVEAAAAAPDHDFFEYPEEDLLELSASTAADNEDYLLYLGAELDDARLAFRLNLMIGARFIVKPEQDGARPTVEEIETTLIWLCYPYLRETVAGITGRSPLPPYMLPALTKMPHPSVRGEPFEE